MNFKDLSAVRNANGNVAASVKPGNAPAKTMAASQPLQQQPATAHPGAPASPGPAVPANDKPAVKPVAAPSKT